MSTYLITRPDLLGIYLNDHLLGASAGVDLIRRGAGVHAGTSKEQPLRRLADEIAKDRQALLDIMNDLGVAVRTYKVWAGWLAEKAGRFKPNGYLLGRSPLSSVVELEGMRLGVQGKAAGWRTLRQLAEQDPRLDAVRLDQLLARAERQADELEQLRVDAAREAFAG